MGVKNTVFAATTTPLAGLAVFRSDTFFAGRTTQQRQFDGYSLIKGYMNSEAAGTLDIYQAATLADAQAIIAAVPAAGVNNGRLHLDTFAHAAAANSPSTPIALVIRAPFIVARYTNGAGAQTDFVLHLEATE